MANRCHDPPVQRRRAILAATAAVGTDTAGTARWLPLDECTVVGCARLSGMVACLRIESTRRG